MRVVLLRQPQLGDALDTIIMFALMMTFRPWPVLTAPLVTGARASTVVSKERFPRDVIFAPSESLGERDMKMAEALDSEISRGLRLFAKKQSALEVAEGCMAKYPHKASNLLASRSAP